ncbi:hypothetical protein ACT7C8_17660 [Bacillus cereus]
MQEQWGLYIRMLLPTVAVVSFSSICFCKWVTSDVDMGNLSIYTD